MSRDPPQRRGAARETAVPLTARRSLAGVQGAQGTARQGGASGTEAASLPLTLRHGMETRCPGGAGQRQRSWLCAKHDSPPGRPLRKRVGICIHLTTRLHFICPSPTKNRH